MCSENYHRSQQQGLLSTARVVPLSYFVLFGRDIVNTLRAIEILTSSMSHCRIRGLLGSVWPTREFLAEGMFRSEAIA